MRDLPVILDLLGDELEVFFTVFRRIGHALTHVDFIPVPAYP